MLAPHLLLTLAIKIVATAVLVIGALKGAERAGPFWGALIISLPVSVGPTYFILAIDHDPAFLARTALVSLAGTTTLGLFLVAYAVLAGLRGTIASLGASLAVWALSSLLVGQIAWNAATASIANLAVFGFGCLATRQLAAAGSPLGRREARWFETPLRALLVGVLVASVTSASYAIGSKATGLLAMFPIGLASLGGILQPRFGGRAVAPIMASALRTVPSLAAGLFVVTLTVESWGKVASLSAALAATLAWPLALVALRNRRRSRLAAASS